MKKHAYLGATVTLALSALGSATALAQAGDPLTCATTVTGGDIRIGSPVRDATGRQIGTVSISQCTVEPGTAKLRVRLSLDLGSDVKVFDLNGVTAKDGGVTLPLSMEQIAGVPAVSNTYAMSQAQTPAIANEN